MLDVSELVAGYGEIDVLRGLTATFEPHRITTIIGANGAGKSTFLKTVFGLLRPRGGEVHFKGQSIAGWTPRRVLDAGIAYVPQGRCNFPGMTVQDNLLVSLDHRRAPIHGHRGPGVAAMYAEFPMLGDKRATLAGNLSGGQQQILEMAMALLHEPEVVLIDEPSLGLSPAMLDQVFARVVEMSTRRQVTVVMVEQNAKQALAISDRGLVLELGRLRMAGAASELLAHPGIRELYLGG
jgi:branched-chain amino acid transport system ATP-binding protein